MLWSYLCFMFKNSKRIHIFMWFEWRYELAVRFFKGFFSLFCFGLKLERKIESIGGEFWVEFFGSAVTNEKFLCRSCRDGMKICKMVLSESFYQIWISFYDFSTPYKFLPRKFQKSNRSKISISLIFSANFFLFRTFIPASIPYHFSLR